MEFKDILKMRLYLAIGCIVAGILMIVGGAVSGRTDTFFSSFGLCLVIIGIVRIRNYKRITKNEQTIRKQEIAETDERNITLSNKARSWAFYLYLVGASVTVLVLLFMGNEDMAALIGYSVCILVALYWVSYFVLKRKY